MLHEGRFSTDKPSCTATCTENYKVITDTNLYCQLCGVNNKIVAKSKEVTRSVEKKGLHDHDCKKGDYEKEYRILCLVVDLIISSNWTYM